MRRERMPAAGSRDALSSILVDMNRILDVTDTEAIVVNLDGLDRSQVEG
jgi:hypothetical protein